VSPPPAGRAPCRSLATARSALVDGALDLDQQERLHAHLVGCAACHADVVELRRLRAALRRPVPAEAPQELARRLVSIAGVESRSPLWSRPFRRTRPGRLTSPRRTSRLRRTAVAVTVGATVTGASVVGYLLAPAETLAAVGDPVTGARTELAAVLGQLPLSGPVVGAVVAAGADLPEPAAASGPAAATRGARPLVPGQARDVLARAAGAAGRVSYRGTQSFWAAGTSRTYSASVLVQSDAGRGTRAQVLDRAGRPVASSTAAVVPVALDDRTLRLLAERYRLQGEAGARVAGRAATLVEAVGAGGLAARWWVDDATGILLGQQAYDERGRTTLQVGFTSLVVSPASSVMAPLPVAASLPTTTSALLTLTSAPVLDQQGWVCHDSLAGLSLVRLRSDDGSAPGVVHLVYSDGLATLGVFEQRGRLGSPPAGSRWDDELEAHVVDGVSTVASWESGGRVFTVVTDGPRPLLAAAVASLPHETSAPPTTMRRIRAGWAELLTDMEG